MVIIHNSHVQVDPHGAALQMTGKFGISCKRLIELIASSASGFRHHWKKNVCATAESRP